MSDLARLVLDEIASDPVALEQLRQLVGADQIEHAGSISAPAFTVATLEGE